MRRFAGIAAVCCGLLGNDLEQRAKELSEIIARKEGFYVKGSIPQRSNNPCALVFTRQRGAVPGPKYRNGYYARFKTAAAGWAACQADIQSKLERGIPLKRAWKYLSNEMEGR